MYADEGCNKEMKSAASLLEIRSVLFDRKPSGPEEPLDNEYDERLDWIKVEIKQDSKHINASN